MSGPEGRPGGTARAYHQSTKHSPESVRRGGRLLDWSRRPDPFKRYVGLPRVELPPDGELVRILSSGAGVIRTKTYGFGDVTYFRTYASAGALYPNEVYVVCGDFDGLPAGVYHFDPLGRSLARLREGDHRAFLVGATGKEPSVAVAPVVLVLTALPWRTAWKYGERGYRHVFWDAGMIVANLLALTASAGLGSRVVTGFVDSEVEALLGIDGEEEFACCLLSVGAGAATPPAGSPPEAAPSERPRSRTTGSFPAIARANDAGRLGTPEEVRDWREGASLPPDPPLRGDVVAIAPADPRPDPIEAVIERRGSARRFDRGEVPSGVLAAILRQGATGAPSDYAPGGAQVVSAYLIANGVEGLEPGAYVRQPGGLLLLRPGRFRREAGYLCLEQRLGADAAATVFLMADLDLVLERFGDRGYRLAQLEGGIAAGRMYLAAYGYRFGATGLTFYDDEVRRFFSPHAARKECLLVVTVGESPRLRRRG